LFQDLKLRWQLLEHCEQRLWRQRPANEHYANLHLKLNVSSQSELFALVIEWLRQHQKIATCDSSYWEMQFHVGTAAGVFATGSVEQAY
jgi:hypothetical protein